MISESDKCFVRPNCNELVYIQTSENDKILEKSCLVNEQHASDVPFLRAQQDFLYNRSVAHVPDVHDRPGYIVGIHQS